MNLKERCQIVFQAGYKLGINSFRTLAQKKVKYLVSDRAKAIIKLALNDLGTNSISDLFHVLYDLNRSIGFELNRLTTNLEKQIKRALLNQSKPEIIQELELKKQALQGSSISYNHCCYSISTCLHPFDIHYNTLQTTETRANQILEQHPFTQSLSLSNLEQWCDWGIWMVSKFQRSYVTLSKDGMDICLKFTITDVGYPLSD